jgi:hypothetical protein
VAIPAIKRKQDNDMKTYILMLITRQQTAVKCQRINADGKGRQGGPERPGKNETE